MQTNLIGYRATGKTTIARLLAEHFGWQWIDTDAEIERRANKTIQEIFVESGEEAFRDLETAVLRDLCPLEQCFLSLGGGAILRSENRDALAAGHTIWLQASPSVIHERIQSDSQSARPNLTPQGGLAEIVEVLATRTPIYKQCADTIIDTDGLSPREVVERIVSQVDFPS